MRTRARDPKIVAARQPWAVRCNRFAVVTGTNKPKHSCFQYSVLFIISFSCPSQYEPCSEWRPDFLTHGSDSFESPTLRAFPRLRAVAKACGVLSPLTVARAVAALHRLPCLTSQRLVVMHRCNSGRTRYRMRVNQHLQI